MLVDTSVWIEHFRRRSDRLSQSLESGDVWTHPFIIGELACGRLARRGEILRWLAELPQAPLMAHDAVLEFVTEHELAGGGIGWIDMHLLASARQARLAFWTLDGRLGRIAAKLALTQTRAP